MIQADTLWAVMAQAPNGREQIIVKIGDDGMGAALVTGDPGMLPALRLLAKEFTKSKGQKVALATFKREGTEAL